MAAGLVALLFVSYIVGSIPFGLWLGRAICHVDLREQGSGNIGATNAWRVLGWRVGIPVFALDLAKGLVPVVAARRLAPLLIPYGHTHLRYTLTDPNGLVAQFHASLIVGCGICAILGHNFSPFLGFKGGKGVATSFGVALAMSPMAGLCGFLVWAAMLSITRIISISSLVGTPVGAYGIWFFNGKAAPFGLFAILATLFVLVKHKANILRLLSGTEPKIEPLLPTIRRLISRTGHSGRAT